VGRRPGESGDHAAVDPAHPWLWDAGLQRDQLVAQNQECRVRRLVNRWVSACVDRGPYRVLRVAVSGHRLERLVLRWFPLFRYHDSGGGLTVGRRLLTVP
jgi:hypothetical protein